MKATNIFQSLKSSGKYNTDGLKPGLPGLSSPIDKKSAPTKLNNDPPKKEITADEINITSYDHKTGKGTRERVFSDGRTVESSFQVKPTTPNDPPKEEIKTPTKKKSCGYKN